MTDSPTPARAQPTLDLEAIRMRYDTAQACKCIGYCHHIDSSYGDIPALLDHINTLAAHAAEMEANATAWMHEYEACTRSQNEAMRRADELAAALAAARQQNEQLRQWLRGELTLADADIDEALGISRATPPADATRQEQGDG